MKQIFIVLLCCLSTSVTFSQKKGASIIITPVSLKVDTMWADPGGGGVMLTGPDKEGNYVFNFTGNFPKTIRIGIDKPVKAQKFFYLEEGYALNVKTDFDKSTSISGKGAANNQVLDEYMTIYIDSYGKADARGMSPAEYYAMGNNMEQKSIDILEANKDKVTPSFYAYQSVRLTYQKLANKVIAPYIYSLGFSKKFSEVVPADYWDLDKQVTIDDRLLGNETYQNFVIGSYPIFLGWRELFREGKLDSSATMKQETKAEQRYRMVEKYYPESKARSMALKTTLENLLDAATDFTKIKPLMDEYIAKHASKEDAEEVTAKYKKMAGLAAGQLPPSFTLKDINGNDVTLKDFAGKVVYMDFWASWCTPCRYEMKNGSPKLHEKFKDNKDVVFLYVSIDDKADAWKKAIADDKIEGIHLLSAGGMNSPVGKAFNITGVPRYIIIGKDGRIFDNNAPRPSEDRTPLRINEALAGKQGR